ncbi:MAG: carboxypeptidase-like regulatory domain-containing protein [Methanoregulaceae archaeon]
MVKNWQWGIVVTGVIVIILILVLISLQEGGSVLGGIRSTGALNGTMNLSLTYPVEGDVYWIDHWPIEVGTAGVYEGSYPLKEIVITTDSGTTGCGNNTTFRCGFTAHEGTNQIMVTAIDTRGNRVSETRNFTVYGSPPPPKRITLYGRVTDMFGKPIPNATVTVLSTYSKGGAAAVVRTQTSENGSYRFEHVSTYFQNISVEKEGYPRKSWEKSFENSTTEFNMHIDIDRSTPREK